MERGRQREGALGCFGFDFWNGYPRDDHHDTVPGRVFSPQSMSGDGDDASVACRGCKSLEAQCWCAEKSRAALDSKPDGSSAPPVRRQRTLSGESFSGEEEWEEFEESERSLRRANRSAVTFCAPEENRVRYIEHVNDLGATNVDCYWQPEEYQAMSQSRMALELRVMVTGGRVSIEGESRRGLGLVCEPETRVMRATKILLTQRAILRKHLEGASSAYLARFSAERSEWARRNALICAQRDQEAANAIHAKATFPSNLKKKKAAAPPPAASLVKGYVRFVVNDGSKGEGNPLSVDSRNLSIDESVGLSGMIRNDTLKNLKGLATDTSQPPARTSIIAAAGRPPKPHQIAAS